MEIIVFKMNNKKGASMAVAWVLLVGLSISLAILVGTWLTKMTKESGDELVSQGEKDQRCADTVLVASDYNCTVGGTSLSLPEGESIFKNSGKFNITKVKCNGVDRCLNSVDCSDESPLGPGMESIALNNCLSDAITDVIPFIDIEGEEVACAEKRVKLQC